MEMLQLPSLEESMRQRQQQLSSVDRARSTDPSSASNRPSAPNRPDVPHRPSGRLLAAALAARGRNSAATAAAMGNLEDGIAPAPAGSSLSNAASSLAASLAPSLFSEIFEAPSTSSSDSAFTLTTAALEVPATHAEEAAPLPLSSRRARREQSSSSSVAAPAAQSPEAPSLSPSRRSVRINRLRALEEKQLDTTPERQLEAAGATAAAAPSNHRSKRQRVNRSQ